ncbi:tetrahydrofolylpolyglutamate synthase [Xylaria bambusicola]|uniref:tetrahydrofolylpolyglutamate synthase n=1 Tax=Xylaria bambusicola TaxID=326684 RepID=UPI002008E068|nr:tetrahydrofolylpolyglutamate synthase [Xylaria bambusicola]KAI0505789.1 tetrahydrofolylpolyglutamate synthase [Xylaria bambusicola]
MHHVFRRIRYSPIPSSTLIVPKNLARCTMATQAARRSYNDAIDALNSLQSPYAIIEARRKAGIRPDATSIAEMRLYLGRIGYSPSDLDRLNILHVAGTKGKGSTCAFAASILAHYQRAHSIPRKVGLFTSPHLIAVRERIRIDGAPVSEELFARYFFEVWDRLGETEARDGPMTIDERLGVPTPPRPIYARYLTLMSYHVFLQEGVDVAVYETGIGGEYDATNIVERPLASGISTLGIDHVFALGNTVEKIAWHKAGIMKPGSAAFTIEQLPEAAQVLQERADAKGVPLKVLNIDPRLSGVHIRPDASFQKRNASLGIALAETALQTLDPEFKRDDSALPREFIDGLEQVVWRGRCEVKTEGQIVWHIDGAHTVDSLKMATKWFADECRTKAGPKALIFNQQGREEAVHFLEGMITALKAHDLGVDDAFAHVVFCTNVTHAETGYKRDFVNYQYDPEAIKALTAQHGFAEKWAALDPKAHITVVPTIEDAINHVRGLSASVVEGQTVQALITGSLHLVGGALAILEGVDAL